jgi:hypothetical protein
MADATVAVAPTPRRSARVDGRKRLHSGRAGAAYAPGCDGDAIEPKSPGMKLSTKRPGKGLHTQASLDRMPPAAHAICGDERGCTKADDTLRWLDLLEQLRGVFQVDFRLVYAAAASSVSALKQA